MNLIDLHLLFKEWKYRTFLASCTANTTLGNFICNVVQLGGLSDS